MKIGKWRAAPHDIDFGLEPRALAPDIKKLSQIIHIEKKRNREKLNTTRGILPQNVLITPVPTFFLKRYLDIYKITVAAAWRSKTRGYYGIPSYWGGVATSPWLVKFTQLCVYLLSADQYRCVYIGSVQFRNCAYIIWPILVSLRCVYICSAQLRVHLRVAQAQQPLIRLLWHW